MLPSALPAFSAPSGVRSMPRRASWCALGACAPSAAVAPAAPPAALLGWLAGRTTMRLVRKASAAKLDLLVNVLSSPADGRVHLAVTSGRVGIGPWTHRRRQWRARNDPPRARGRVALFRPTRQAAAPA